MSRSRRVAVVAGALLLLAPAAWHRTTHAQDVQHTEESEQPAPLPDDGQPGGPDAGADGDSPDEQDMSAAAEVFERAQVPLRRAFARLSVRDWEGCIAPFGEAAEILGEHAVLGGLRDQCLYNVACAYSRTDRLDAAVEAFTDSIAHGLRPVVQPLSQTDFALSPGLTLAHILVDSDLDVLRSRDDFQRSLDVLVRAGEPQLRVPAAETRTLPAIVVLLEGAQTHEEAASSWLARAGDDALVLVTLEPPVRPRADVRRWRLEDGDARFGTAKVRQALDVLGARREVDRARVYVVAAGPDSSEVAWEAALAERARVAGLAVRGGRFHAAWHADAIATLRPGWRVLLADADPRARALLRSAGAELSESGAETFETDVTSEFLRRD